jgi:hypothetical protein
MSKRHPAKTGGRAPDRALVLTLFDQIFPAPSWLAWRAWVCAVFGLPMTEAEAAIFRACTGRPTLPTAPAREIWTIAGRRSGKSRMAAFCTAYLAACRTYRLAPGEHGRVPIVSPSKSQGQIIFNYALAMIESIPALAGLIARKTIESIDLTNNVSVTIQTASFRTPRGFSNVAANFDEAAFWRDDSGANPDAEIARAVRPALASVPGSLLVSISSPYSQRGELFNMYDRHFGRDDSDVLIWQSASLTMNPTIAQSVVDRAIADDPASAAAEWLGLFRADLESLFAREALDAVIARGRFELPPIPGVAYTAFTDPSGGSADAFTLAIAHRDPGGVPVLDLVREVRPPFSPEAVVADFSREMARYHVGTVTGDHYAAEWPVEQFRKCGIVYVTAELTRSELYLEMLPMVNSGGCALLDHPRLLAQLAGLERRVGRSGKDAIDHRRGQHDDLANAAAGALVHAVRSTGKVSLGDFGCAKNSGLRESSRVHCVLHGGDYQPADPICRKECKGWQAVEPQWRAYQQLGGSQPLRLFVREHFTSATIERNMWGDLVREAEGMYGV